ncbi:hypothetical protein MBANPS3_002470 [Mucor bainieri]
MLLCNPQVVEHDGTTFEAEIVRRWRDTSDQKSKFYSGEYTLRLFTQECAYQHLIWWSVVAHLAEQCGTYLAVDRPSPYITRINHIATKQITSNVSLFGATVLPVVVLVWQIKQQVIIMKSKMLASQSSQARQRGEWL